MAISDRTKEILIAALADRKAAEELIAVLENTDLSEGLEDLADRVEDLENAA